MDSFEQLYTALFPRLRAYAVRLGLPRDEAEAVVHDAFVAYLVAKGPIDDPAKWLYGATRNCAVNYWRAEERVDRILTMAEQRVVPSYHRHLGLRRLLGKLPRLQLRIIVLRARGWRMKRIAARFHISVSWTEKLLSRVRKAAAEEIDLSNRRRVGRRVRPTDTYGVIPSVGTSRCAGENVMTLPGAGGAKAGSRWQARSAQPPDHVTPHFRPRRGRRRCSGAPPGRAIRRDPISGGCAATRPGHRLPSLVPSGPVNHAR